MTISTTDKTGLKFIEEGLADASTFGVRLTAGTRSPILFLNEDLRFIPEESESEEIDSTGWVRGAPRVGGEVGSQIETYLRYGMMDHPWAASMRADSTANTDHWISEVDSGAITADYNIAGQTITGGGSDFTNVNVGRTIRITGTTGTTVGIARVTNKAADVLTISLIRMESGNADWSETSGDIENVTQLEHVVPGDSVWSFNTERTPGLLTNEFHNFPGITWGGWELRTEAKSNIVMRWPVRGKTETTETQEFGSVEGAAIDTTTAPIFSLVNTNIRFLEGGTRSLQLTSMTMTYDPGLRPRDTIGAGIGPSSFGVGKHRVNGTMRLFYEDGTRYDKFLDEVLTTIDYVLEDSQGQHYVLSTPVVKLRNGNRSTPRQEDDRIGEYEFSGFYDVGSDNGFFLSRST